jgi:hypothetical protein
MRRKGNTVVESPRVLKLTHEQVEVLLRKHTHEHVGYKRLAVEFKVSRRYVQLICLGLRRGRR